MDSFNVGRTPPLTFGAGRLNKVPDLVEQLGGGPVLLISDAALVEFGAIGRVSDALSAQGIDHVIAAEVSGEPKEALVDDLCTRARDYGAKCIIGLGGGAAMDTAKLVAALAPSSRPARDFALAASPLPAQGIPSIAIPTTAGTGSEVTRTSIVSTPEGFKNWYWGEELMFSQAVLDPELTLSLPPHLTAWTGIDAVAHALEASTARTTSPAGLLFGLEALRILGEYLPRAVQDGSDVEVRGKVLWASTVAGLALHNCNTHMGHNISHSLGSLAPVHHGLATGLGLEVAIPFLVDRAEGQENYAAAAKALGGVSLSEQYTNLMRNCGIERKLPDVCAAITKEALAEAMKSDANYSMSQNAACKIDHDDLDDMADAVLSL